MAKQSRGEVDPGLQIVVTVTGHGLKDIDTALAARPPLAAAVVPDRLDEVARTCDLRR